MARRIGVTLSLVAFAVCLMAGLAAENPFSTVVSRALVAMCVSLVLGLVLGGMAQKMLDEDLETRRIQTKPAIPEANSAPKDR